MCNAVYLLKVYSDVNLRFFRVPVMFYEAVDGVGNDGAEVEWSFTEQTVSQQWLDGFCISPNDIYLTFPID